MGTTVVQILGLGLSGFGFLLMYLAYKLILRIIGVNPVQVPILSAIKTYMLVCVVMTLAVGFFTYIDAVHKEDKIAEQSKTIQQSEKALSVLSTTKKNSVLSDSIISNSGNTADIAAAKDEQKKVVDSLSTIVNNNSTPDNKAAFEKFKNSMLAYADSLSIPLLTPEKKLSLQKEYLFNVKKINDISSESVLKNLPAKFSKAQ